MTPKEIAMKFLAMTAQTVWSGDVRQYLEADIQAAIDEAVSQRTLECANEVQNVFNRFKGTEALYTWADKTKQAVLALNKPPVPPVPIWKHKPGCPIPYKWDDGIGWSHAINSVEKWLPKNNARCCDGCGVPKPEEKL